MTDVPTLPSREDVEKALEAVHDPHVPVSLRRMGMLREIEIGEDGTVTVQVCIPCMGCPGVGMLRENVREAVLAVPAQNSRSQAALHKNVNEEPCFCSRVSFFCCCCFVL